MIVNCISDSCGKSIYTILDDYLQVNRVKNDKLKIMYWCDSCATLIDNYYLEKIKSIE